MKKHILKTILCLALINIVACEQSTKKEEDAVASGTIEKSDIEKDAHLITDVNCYLLELTKKEVTVSINKQMEQYGQKNELNFSPEEKIILRFIEKKGGLIEQELNTKYQQHPIEENDFRILCKSYKKKCNDLTREKKEELLEILNFQSEKGEFVEEMKTQDKLNKEKLDSATNSLQEQFNNAMKNNNSK